MESRKEMANGKTIDESNAGFSEGKETQISVRGLRGEKDRTLRKFHHRSNNWALREADQGGSKTQI